MWVKKSANIVVSMVITPVCFFTASVFASSLPTWLTSPTIKDGLAAVDCVKFSGNWSSDAKISSANARIALAQQIEIKVESLDKTYDTRHSQSDDVVVTTKFSSVSKQFTKQVLSGSRIVKTDVVAISGKEYYCALATLEPAVTKQVFDSIVTATNKTLAPEEESELFEQFKNTDNQTTEDISKLTNSN